MADWSAHHANHANHANYANLHQPFWQGQYSNSMQRQSEQTTRFVSQVYNNNNNNNNNNSDKEFVGIVTDPVTKQRYAKYVNKLVTERQSDESLNPSEQAMARMFERYSGNNYPFDANQAETEVVQHMGPANYKPEFSDEQPLRTPYDTFMAEQGQAHEMTEKAHTWAAREVSRKAEANLEGIREDMYGPTGYTGLHPNLYTMKSYSGYTVQPEELDAKERDTSAKLISVDINGPHQRPLLRQRAELPAWQPAGKSDTQLRNSAGLNSSLQPGRQMALDNQTSQVALHAELAAKAGKAQLGKDDSLPDRQPGVVHAETQVKQLHARPVLYGPGSQPDRQPGVVHAETQVKQLHARPVLYGPGSQPDHQPGVVHAETQVKQLHARPVMTGPGSQPDKQNSVLRLEAQFKQLHAKPLLTNNKDQPGQRFNTTTLALDRPVDHRDLFDLPGQAAAKAKYGQGGWPVA